MNAVRMGFNLLNDAWQVLSGPNPITAFDDFSFSISYCEFDCRVRIDDTSHAQVLVDGLPTSLVLCTHDCSNLEAVNNLLTIFEPNISAFVRFGCTIFAGIESEVDVDRRRIRSNLLDDMSLRPSRQLAVHQNTSDSDSLLPSGLAYRVEA